MENPMKKHSKKIGAALAAVLAIPAVAFAFGGGPGHEGKGDPAKRAERRAAMIAQFDTNGDGQLDDAERAAAHEAMAKKRFEAMDTNKDGVLSLDEFKAGRRMHRGFRHGGAPPADAPQK